MRWLIVAALVLAGCSDDVENPQTTEDAGVIADASSTPDADIDASIETDTGQTADAGLASGWNAAAPLAVGARQETAVVELDGKIYVIGGYNGSIQIVPTVEVWDPATDSWDRVADLPVPMHHANAVAYDGRIWVLGFLGAGFAADGRGFVWDPAADSWSPVADMPTGTERGSSAIGVLNDRIYLFGGLRGGSVRDGSYYDPVADSWTPVADAPRDFDHAGFGVIDGELVVAGGRNQSIGAHVTDVDRYDPTDDAWTSGAPMPTSRGGVAAAVFEGELYVFGGEGNGGDPSGVFPQVEAYDPVADSWAELADMDDPRHGMGAASFEGGILVPGGARTQAFGAVDAVHIYVP